MPWFRRKAKEVMLNVKPAEPTKIEAKLETLAEEPVDTAALEELRMKWQHALGEAWDMNARDHLREKVVGVQRTFYYIMRIIERSVNPGLTVEKSLCIDEKLAPVIVTFTVSFDERGSAISLTSEPADPKIWGLSPELALRTVSRFCGGDYFGQ